MAASVKAIASPSVVPLGEEGYEYDWAEETTTDPRFCGINLPYGGREVQGVWLDGEDVTELRITKLKTGSRGFLEAVIQHPNGAFANEIWDNWNQTWVLEGSENYPKIWNEYCFERGHRFGQERCATKILRGRVKYLPTAGFPQRGSR